MTTELTTDLPQRAALLRLLQNRWASIETIRHTFPQQPDRVNATLQWMLERGELDTREHAGSVQYRAGTPPGWPDADPRLPWSQVFTEARAALIRAEQQAGRGEPVTGLPGSVTVTPSRKRAAPRAARDAPKAQKATRDASRSQKATRDAPKAQKVTGKTSAASASKAARKSGGARNAATPTNSAPKMHPLRQRTTAASPPPGTLSFQEADRQLGLKTSTFYAALKRHNKLNECVWVGPRRYVPEELITWYAELRGKQRELPLVANDDPAYLSAFGVAEVLGCGLKFMYQLRDAGRLRPAGRSDRHKDRYALADVTALKQELDQERPPDGWTAVRDLGEQLGVRADTVTAWLRDQKLEHRMCLSAAHQQQQTMYAPPHVISTLREHFKPQAAPDGWVSVHSVAQQAGVASSSALKWLATHHETRLFDGPDKQKVAFTPAAAAAAYLSQPHARRRKPQGPPVPQLPGEGPA